MVDGLSKCVETSGSHFGVSKLLAITQILILGCGGAYTIDSILGTAARVML
jgi:hypothetical protein